MTDEEKVRKYNPYGQYEILRARITDLEKENAELIEKMKRCTNCKWEINGMDYEQGEPCTLCKAYSNWELAD